MSSRSSDALWIACAFCANFVVAGAVLVVLGTDERGLNAALAATARLAFMVFLPAYCGGALVSLFGGLFAPIKLHAREFGLAFASALLVHLGMVLWRTLAGDPPGAGLILFFGLGAVFAYLLALFSIPSLRNALGRTSWLVLNKVGMNYIAYAFFVDFAKHPLEGGAKRVMEYLPFVILAVAAPLLRLGAFARRYIQEWRGRATAIRHGQ